jgi:hypothetical protein
LKNWQELYPSIKIGNRKGVYVQSGTKQSIRDSREVEHTAMLNPLSKRSSSLLYVVFNSSDHLHHRFIRVVEDSSVPLYPEVPEDNK